MIFLFCQGEVLQAKNKLMSNLKEPIDYVNPQIGTIGHLLTATAPIVQMPFGMVKLTSNPWPEVTDRYLADKIFSFSLRDVPRYSTRTGATWIMATTGSLAVTPAEIASRYDHDHETVTPYYSSLLLEDYNIVAEYSVTEHAAYYQFIFPENNNSHILLGSNKTMSIVNDQTIAGTESGAYFYAEFSKPFASYGTWEEKNVFTGSNNQQGDNIGAYVDYSTFADEKIEVKVGISHISIAQAKQNLEKEIPVWDFDQVKYRTRQVWNESLGKIKVEGGTKKERTIFYTAMYRCLAGRITNLTEYGRYYSRLDNQVHSTEGHDFYNISFNWGCDGLYPLMMILEPERINDIMKTYVRMEEQAGWLSRHRNGMIGHHETVSLLDAYRKGFRGFDVDKAYQGVKNYAMGTTMLSRARGDLSATELDSVYYEKGFFPALAPGQEEWVPQVDFHRQAVSITLEAAQDDWAISELAKELGKEEDFSYFNKRAYNYQNVYHKGTGFMRPKTAEGKWIEPFDPIWSGGQGGRAYYTENNGWNYTWYVRHDVQGLINLMGGKDKFINKLDSLFTTTVPLLRKYHFLAQFPDMTGWIGMYSHGNENVRYIPYLYNFAGEPWRTQKRVRDIMKIWCGAGPLGICGDEDGGKMSSWYVLSAMGFYQVCLGRPVYDMGSPIFDKVTIDTGDGKNFVIEAKNVSDKNKYIQSATLNGEVLEKPWFEHTDMINGSSLVLNMGPRPNKDWGSEPRNAPPSMSIRED